MARRQEHERSSSQGPERDRWGTPRGREHDDDEWRTRGPGGRQLSRSEDDDDDDRFGSTRHQGGGGSEEARGAHFRRYGGQQFGSQRGGTPSGSYGQGGQRSRGMTNWEEEDDYARGYSAAEHDPRYESFPTRGRMSHGGGRPMDYAEDWGLHDDSRGPSSSGGRGLQSGPQSGRYGRERDEDDDEFGRDRPGFGPAGTGYGPEGGRGDVGSRLGGSGSPGGPGPRRRQDDDDDRRGRRGFRGMDPEDWRDR